MMPAVTSQARTCVAPSLRSSRVLPNAASAAVQNATTKKTMPGARVLRTYGMTLHHSL